MEGEGNMRAHGYVTTASLILVLIVDLSVGVQLFLGDKWSCGILLIVDGDN